MPGASRLQALLKNKATPSEFARGRGGLFFNPKAIASARAPAVRYDIAADRLAAAMTMATGLAAAVTMAAMTLAAAGGFTSAAGFATAAGSGGSTNRLAASRLAADRTAAPLRTATTMAMALRSTAVHNRSAAGGLGIAAATSLGFGSTKHEQQQGAQGGGKRLTQHGNHLLTNKNMGG